MTCAAAGGISLPERENIKSYLTIIDINNWMMIGETGEKCPPPELLFARTEVAFLAEGVFFRDDRFFVGW